MAENWTKADALFDIGGLRIRWFKNESGTVYRLLATTVREFRKLGELTLELELPASAVEAANGQDVVEARIAGMLHEKVTLEAFE